MEHRGAGLGFGRSPQRLDVGDEPPVDERVHCEPERQLCRDEWKVIARAKVKANR
jgi:hypothetical protein